MVESEAKEIDEETMLGAVMFGHKHFQPVIDAIIRLAEKAAKEPRNFSAPENGDVEKAVLDVCEAELRDAYKNTVKQERYAAVDAVKAKVMAALCPAEGEAKFPAEKVKAAFKEAQSKVVRWNILDTGSRIDGRDVRTVRPIVSQVGVLPRAHGSSLFTRGETQALVVATLGTGEDEQFIDALEGTYKETFLLALQLPLPTRWARPAVWAPRAVARSATASSPGAPCTPSCRRPTSSRTRSASCPRSPSPTAPPRWPPSGGASLSLMDAGVPLRRPVAGIAMGLILEGERYAVLSDILGDEDHLGDMDFKVAGTEAGITSLQMDIKIAGITEEIMKVALHQAQEGRVHILGEMAKALTDARPELGEYAPRIETMQIPTDKIREVIGTGGKVIPRDRREDRRQDQHRRHRHGEDRLQRRQGHQGRL